MRMSTGLTRRLQVLLDESRYERLERLARRRGTSVATIVREAIDTAFPEEADDRAEAARQLLAAAPIAVGDWTSMKHEIEDSYQALPR